MEGTAVGPVLTCAPRGQRSQRISVGVVMSDEAAYRRHVPAGIGSVESRFGMSIGGLVSQPGHRTTSDEGGAGAAQNPSRY